ncbi:MAG: ABC transporter permease [Acidobacteria bacterium]|nr:ABC transporter permease [Acidobacteriota bacterium]
MPAATQARWSGTIAEAWSLAAESLRSQALRSSLAVAGIVIGIVTVVLVASVLANVRNQVALLFRELGTDNIFAFHFSGDPYSPPREREAGRRALKPEYAREIARRGDAIDGVGVQIIVPNVVGGRALVARAGDNDSDRVLVEGSSPEYFDIVGAEFLAGRPFTDLEDRVGAPVAVIGSSLARSLYGGASALGRPLTLGSQSFTVVGVLSPRPGGFFGENRQDRVMAMPIGTARRLFGAPDRVVLYARAREGQLQRAQLETEAILRQLRGLGPDDENDFNLSTAEQIIGTFDEVGAQIAFVTIGLAIVSLLIGAIGIANVMIIAVTERTREIGLRLAVGARRRDVLTQFLIEAGVLSTLGGIAGVTVAVAIGLLLRFVVSDFSAVPPVWSVAAGLAASTFAGVAAGFLPARRAAGLDPVEALRHE